MQLGRVDNLSDFLLWQGRILWSICVFRMNDDFVSMFVENEGSGHYVRVSKA